MKAYIGWFFLTSHSADDPDASIYNGKIIECKWNSEEKVWVCMRVRVDKGTPNDFRTYTKVHSVSHFNLPHFFISKLSPGEIMLF